MVDFLDPNNPNYPDMTICDLGVNINYKSRYLPEVMYNNHAHEMDHWTEKFIWPENGGRYSGRWPITDLSGHVTHLRANRGYYASFFGGRNQNLNPAIDSIPYEAGNYIIETAGSGTLGFGGDIFIESMTFSPVNTTAIITVNTPNNGINLQLKATSPTNPLRIIKFYKQGVDYDATYPQFTRLWRNASIFRFLNPLWASDNFVVDVSGNKAMRIELSGVGLPSATTYTSVVNFIRPGLLFSGRETGSSGIIRAVDYRSLISDDWFPPSLAGTWLIYQPLSPSTPFAPYEEIKIAGIANTFRVGKYFDWGNNTSYTGIPPGGTNGIEGATPFEDQWKGDGLANWQQYPAQYSESRPCSYYKIVKFLNEINRDGWINIPHLASDHYCSSVAIYIRDNLASHLKLYVEANNEPWNPLFGHNRHFRNLGLYYLPNSPIANVSDPTENGRRAMALSGINQIRIFKNILSGSGRTVYGILNVQSTNYEFPTVTLGWTGLPGDVRQVIDGIGMAPYFGGRDEFTQNEILYSSTAHILHKLEFTSITLGLDTVRLMNAATTGAGYKLFIYECGQHIDSYKAFHPDYQGGFGPPSAVEITRAAFSKIYGIQTSLQMGQMYFYYFAGMKQLLGYTPWGIPVHYSSMTPLIKGTWWGLLDAYDSLTPKYYNGWLRAILQCSEPSGQSQSGAFADAKSVVKRRNNPLHLKRTKLNRRR